LRLDTWSGKNRFARQQSLLRHAMQTLRQRKVPFLLAFFIYQLIR
jgi:hypothetical protein